jgi:hypothetical protein
MKQVIHDRMDWAAGEFVGRVGDMDVSGVRNDDVL